MIGSVIYSQMLVKGTLNVVILLLVAACSARLFVDGQPLSDWEAEYCLDEFTSQLEEIRVPKEIEQLARDLRRREPHNWNMEAILGKFPLNLSQYGEKGDLEQLKRSATELLVSPPVTLPDSCLSEQFEDYINRLTANTTNSRQKRLEKWNDYLKLSDHITGKLGLAQVNSSLLL